MNRLASVERKRMRGKAGHSPTPVTSGSGSQSPRTHTHSESDASLGYTETLSQILEGDTETGGKKEGGWLSDVPVILAWGAWF